MSLNRTKYSPQEKSKIALEATAQYFQAKEREAKLTGKPPTINPEELMAFINNLQAQATMPADVAAERQKQAQKAEAK